MTIIDEGHDYLGKLNISVKVSTISNVDVDAYLWHHLVAKLPHRELPRCSD